jgi:hypothetical protein
MSTLRQVQLAMNSVGPLADLLVVDEYEAEGLWHIAIDETIELFAELAEPRGALVLSIPLGAPKDPVALYELALSYAALWRETDGSRLALDAPGGGLSLIGEIGAQGLTPQSLAAAISAAGERARAWKRIIAGERAQSEDSLGVAATEGFIRI